MICQRVHSFNFATYGKKGWARLCCGNRKMPVCSTVLSNRDPATTSTRVRFSSKNSISSPKHRSMQLRSYSNPEMSYEKMHSAISAQKRVIPSDHPVIQSIERALKDEILPAAICQSVTEKKITLECYSNRASEEKLVAVLAISGGCDSIGLLHGFMTLLSRNQNGRLSLKLSDKSIDCDVHVAHFDHCQRGIESDKDRTFVESLCEDYGVPCHCYYWNDLSNSTRNHHSKFSQSTARAWRRELLQTLLIRLRRSNSNSSSTLPGFVLTAHHADDNDETILLKFLRGSHITSLSGIKTCSMITPRVNKDTILIARPLLNIRKTELKDFLTEYFEGSHGNEYPWREDQSNKSEKYLRNRVRNELIPLLSELSGGKNALEKRLINLSVQAAQIKEALNFSSRYPADSVSGDTFPIRTGSDFDLIDEEAIYNWAINLMNCGDIVGNLSYGHLQQILHQLKLHSQNKQWALEVGSGWIIERCGDVLQCYHGSYQKGVNQDWQWSIIDNTTNDINYGENSEFVKFNICIPKVYEQNFCTYMKIELAQSNMNMKFKPHWQKEGSPKKLKDILRGQKIPLHLRSTTPLLLFDDNKERRIIAIFVPETNSINPKLLVDSDFIASDKDPSGHSVENISILIRRKD